MIAGVIVAVFFAMTALAAAGSRPPRNVPMSGAEQYVAADGTRAILTGPRSTQVRWTSHQPGIRPFVDGPPEFVRATVDEPDHGSAGAWLVESEDDGQGSHPHLLRLDRDGLRTWTAMWPEQHTFTPGRLEVPADPRAGQQETTTGTASNERGTVPYSSTLQVLDAASTGPGCLEFRRTDRIGTAAERVTSRTRCPDRGVVSLTLPVEPAAGPAAEATWSLVPEWPEGADPRPDLDLTDVAAGPLTGLQPEPLTFERGRFATLVPPAGAPQLIDDRLVTANTQTGNIVWAEGAGATYRPGPWVSVGGDILSTARCGEVLAVATSRRQLVAHGGSGRWLWTSEFADVVGSPPTRMDDRFLVATKDGELHAVSCRDGRVTWSAGPVVSVQPPAVGPAGVLVAGDGGVRLLDPTTGRSRWERDLPDDITGLAQFDELAFVGDDGNRLFVLDAASGALLTTLSLPDQAEELHRVGDTIVARSTTRILGVAQGGSTEDWRLAWSLPFTGHTSLAGADHVVVASVDELVVVDAHGALVERRPLAIDPATASVFLSRTPDGLLAADGLGNVVRWRR